MKKTLIVGSGISGCVIARELADNGDQVLVIDKRSHVGGNIYDYRDKNGIMIHKYGSHIFHTNNKRVWNYMERFCEFNTYMHKVLGLLDGIETHIPFNLNTLYDVFPKSMAERLEEKLLCRYELNSKVAILEFQKEEDKDLKYLSEYVYQKIFLEYTKKQWGVSPEGVDGAVTARVPVYISKDNRYFQDKYQGIPLGGYTKLIENMLDHKNIKLKLNTDFNELSEVKDFDRIIYTGPIDEYFDYKYGELGYRSVYFKMETHDREYYQQTACVNYPCNYDFTRIHEYKHYLDDKSSKTVIAKEYSETFERGKNERYYPIPSDENRILYEKYKQEADKIEGLYFLGRLGEYKYYDMDKAAARALEFADELIKGDK